MRCFTVTPKRVNQGIRVYPLRQPSLMVGHSQSKAIPVDVASYGADVLAIYRGIVRSNDLEQFWISHDPDTSEDDRALVMIEVPSLFPHRGTTIVRVEDDQSNVISNKSFEVIAKGNGRNGESDPYMLAILRKGVTLRIVRGSRSGRKSEVMFLNWNGEELVLSSQIHREPSPPKSASFDTSATAI